MKREVNAADKLTHVWSKKLQYNTKYILTQHSPVEKFSCKGGDRILEFNVVIKNRQILRALILHRQVLLQDTSQSLQPCTQEVGR